MTGHALALSQSIAGNSEDTGHGTHTPLRGCTYVPSTPALRTILRQIGQTKYGTFSAMAPRAPLVPSRSIGPTEYRWPVPTIESDTARTSDRIVWLSDTELVRLRAPLFILTHFDRSGALSALACIILGVLVDDLIRYGTWSDYKHEHADNAQLLEGVRKFGHCQPHDPFSIPETISSGGLEPP